MTPLMISILAFAGVTALVGVLAFVLNDGGTKTVERLDSLTGRRKRDDEGTTILKKTAIETDKRSLLEALTPNLPSLQKLITQADVHIKPSTLFGIGVVLGILGTTASWMMGVQIYLAPLAGILMFTIPFTWLITKRAMRLKHFASQLPDALELVARALRAGHSLAAGMHVVAEEMPTPVADEFNRVYEEQNLGIPIEEAMKSMCDRVPNLDLRFFVTSVLIQRQTGGDLAEILDKIGYVIRERFRILGQVKALTAEGRLSGVILIALPFAMFLLMMHIKYDYIEKLWTHPLGIKMSIFALIAQLLGAIVIRKIVNIKV
ncbi:MAG: type II secretion system F family protein [Gemmataceae bacterium]|nr:type II secretion system F family protein [Gemmataceae bacterium]MCI0739118.1 type II secretion system F family protein [Gemmataceae bacterium]